MRLGTRIGLFITPSLNALPLGWLNPGEQGSCPGGVCVCVPAQFAGAEGSRQTVAVSLAWTLLGMVRGWLSVGIGHQHTLCAPRAGRQGPRSFQLGVLLALVTWKRLVGEGPEAAFGPA